jgi:hypothetical protein
MNCTLMEMTRYLLHDAGLPDIFWGYMILHATVVVTDLLGSA